VDTSVHGGLDERANILVFDGTLSGDLVETSSVSTITHRLILKITLATLVTDRAI
jgi:hypothetical protein